jgi:hypothetical protein
MKNLFLSAIGVSICLATSLSADAAIFLLYGSTENPVAVVDESQIDGVVQEVGYLGPHAPVWVPVVYGASGGIMVQGTVPLAFKPQTFSNSTGGYMPMSSLYMTAPTASRSPELSRAVQSGHSWSSYQKGINASGVGLVYPSSYGANLSPSQKSASGNRSRAQAFRLDYYK